MDQTWCIIDENFPKKRISSVIEYTSEKVRSKLDILTKALLGNERDFILEIKSKAWF